MKFRFLPLCASLATAYSAIVRRLASRRGVALVALLMLVTVGSVWRVRVASSVPASTHDAVATELRHPRADLPVAAAVASEGSPETRPTGIAAIPARADLLAKTQAFQDWLTDWRRADASAQSDLAAGGFELARERRTALKHLIQTDPRLALEHAVPVGLRAELPAAVQAQLETRLDARGDFEVTYVCNHTVGHDGGGPAAQHASDSSHLQRSAIVAGARYEAYVFGRRESQATKHGLPIHGIALDGVVALEETPYRQIDDREKSSRGLPSELPAVLVGDEAISFATSAEFTALAERLVARESAPGPMLMSPGETAAPVVRIPETAAIETPPPSWILGNKRVLWLKLEFADDPGAPATDADLITTGAAVTDFFTTTSYGKTTMSFTILPGLLRLPRTKAFYNTSVSTADVLSTDAKALAKQYDAANGNIGTYDPDKADRWIMVFKRVSAYSFGGAGQLGGPVVFLNGRFDAQITAHELGHTQGLPHAHSWGPSTTSAIGPGTPIDYGDAFDRMGVNPGDNDFFNVAHKFKLGYLDATGVTTVTTTGNYRLTRHDHRDSTGIRALRVGAGHVEYEYWLEHRPLAPVALTGAQRDRLQNGVVLHWGPQKLPKIAPGPGSYLLDMTPGTAAGMNDAPLRIGETFTDPDAGITIQPLALGGTAPNEYIDVQISFGAIDGNRNPVLVSAPPAGSVNARTNLILTASATDPDGDPLYYRWDFGDGKTQPNLNSVTQRYTKGGIYPVSVSAHDGKGGVSVKTYTLDVVDTLLNWTQRGRGVTSNELTDVVFSGAQFVAVGSSSTVLTSVDGIAWVRQAFAAGINLTGVAYNGTRYVASGYRLPGPADVGLVAYSGDGVAWTTVNIPTGSARFFSVAYGAGRFVAVGEAGSIYSSTDGSTWAAATAPATGSLYRAVFSDGLFVVCGANGRLLTSPDGINWMDRSLPTSGAMLSVARYNNRWFTSLASTFTYSSPDAVVWTRVPAAPGISEDFIYQLTVTAGVLLGSAQNGKVVLSENGQAWSSVQLDARANAKFNGSAEGKGLIVTVGTSGNIFSASLPTTFSLPNLAPALRVPVEPLKVSVGKTNILPAGGVGFTKLELFANNLMVSEITGASGTFTWTPPAIGNYSLIVRGIDATGASVISAPYTAQAALPRWIWRNPSPAGVDLRGAVRVDGKWWVVGNCGTFFTLDADGNFDPVDFSTTQHLTSIAYANGRFVVTAPFTDAGSRRSVGALWTSPNGYNWTPLLTGENSSDLVDLNYVAYAGDRWIAVGTGGAMRTSPDAVVWTRQNATLTVGLNAFAYGNGLYAVVGNTGKIATSANSVTWTERTSGVTTNLRNITFNNGTFVAVGDSGVVLTSTDGIGWTKRPIGTAANLYGAAVVKGSYVVAGDAGTVYTSADGVSWTAATVEDRVSHFLMVAGGEGEGLLAGRAGELYSATTATTWKRANRGTGDSRSAVIYAGGRFVAVGQAVDPVLRNAVIPPVAVSSDGITWTRANSNAGFSTLNDVIYAQTRYVAVGDAGRIFTSLDALTWTERATGSSTQRLAVGASPTLFVAAGASGSLLTSADGTTWTPRTSGVAAALRGAAFGNNRYVVVGDAGTALSSSDGTTWTAATSGVTAQLLNVSWFQNIGFLAAGASGVMLNSADGLTWRTVETGVADTIYSITQTSIGFLAPAGTAGTMLMSLDGTNWSIGTIAADRAVRGIASSAGTIVAVGDNGAVLAFDLVDSAPAPTVAAAPQSQTANLGDMVRLSVTARNTSSGAYQWFKDGTPIVGANGPTYATTVSDSSVGRYTVTITTPTGTVTTVPAALTLPIPPPITSGPSARFIIGRPGGFTPNSVGVTSPVWSIGAGLLPPWAAINASTGSISGTPPDATGSPFVFAVALHDGPTSRALQTFTLTVQRGHSADVSPADGALNLAELTRVIELYNTSSGTIRTGGYIASAGTVDGYASAPSRTAAAPATPHTADTNADGRLSLMELTRVIELFNTRSGTTRHGLYRSDATTIDGFAPGP
jgi:photosystem II stability/assembly factor-like uncharacterized protein